MKGPVVIIDSRAQTSMRMNQALSQADFQVVAVASPRDAVARYGTLDMRLAVIELDAFTPEIAATAAELKHHWPNIGIVALASPQRGKTDTEMLAGARAVAAHAFYVHPVAPSDLARRLDELLRQGVKTTWEDALNGWDTLGVDLVVTDIFMPGMGGVEGIRQVRAAWAPVPIVAFSEGLDSRMPPDKALLAAQKTGADAILVKPLSEPRVMAAVRSAFSARETARASA
jgi:DNA-binding NarL/FixJ family response regulator